MEDFANIHVIYQLGSSYWELNICPRSQKLPEAVVGGFVKPRAIMFPYGPTKNGCDVYFYLRQEGLFSPVFVWVFVCFSVCLPVARMSQNLVQMKVCGRVGQRPRTNKFKIMFQ